jgi:hypothetical protein
MTAIQEDQLVSVVVGALLFFFCTHISPSESLIARTTLFERVACVIVHAGGVRELRDDCVQL